MEQRIEKGEKSKMNLLILDDEIYTVRALQKSVNWKEAGIDEVFIAFNAEKAREIVKEEQMDVILTDIEMPRESGLSFLEWMKSTQKEYKAICMTCHAEFSYAQKAVGLGVMEYLIKPVNVEELISCIKKAVQAIRSERESRDKTAEGKLWEHSKRRVQRDFWQDLVMGAIGEKPDRIQEKAAKYGISYNVNERFRIGLFCIRDMNERKEEWAKNVEIMKFIMENIAKDILNDGRELEQAGWKGEKLWILFGAKAADNLLEKVNRYLEEVKTTMQFSVAVYLSEAEFGEELQNTLKWLEEQNEKNVSIECGIVDEEMRIRERHEKAAFYQKIQTKRKEKDLEGLKEILTAYVKEQQYVDRRELFLEGERIKFELLLFLQENYLNQEELWTEELMEKELLIHQSRKKCLEWELEAIERTQVVWQNRTQENDTIGAIKKYIQENLENRITRELIAEKIHFSGDYISRIFKKETGISLNEYITEQKVEYAKQLIREENESIGNIAVRLGYSSFSYFSDIFKRNTGCLPSEYKKGMGKQNFDN